MNQKPLHDSPFNYNYLNGILLYLLKDSINRITIVDYLGAKL
jgi:hypothetical protein